MSEREPVETPVGAPPAPPVGHALSRGGGWEPLRSALLLSAISAAGSIPVLLLAVPAGTLGDLVDRRRLILVSQIVMLIAAAALAVLAAESALTPVVLLALLFLIGVGGAASAPT